MLTREGKVLQARGTTGSKASPNLTAHLQGLLMALCGQDRHVALCVPKEGGHHDILGTGQKAVGRAEWPAGQLRPGPMAPATPTPGLLPTPRHISGAQEGPRGSRVSPRVSPEPQCAPECPSWLEPHGLSSHYTPLGGPFQDRAVAPKQEKDGPWGLTPGDRPIYDLDLSPRLSEPQVPPL